MGTTPVNDPTGYPFKPPNKPTNAEVPMPRGDDGPRPDYPKGPEEETE